MHRKTFRQQAASILFASLALTAALITTGAHAAPADNKNLVIKVFDAMEKGDLDFINGAFDPKGVSIVGTEERPRGGPFKTFAEAAPFPAALSQRSLKIEEILAEGDLVAVRSLICGNHAQKLLEFEPTGKRLCARYLNIYRVSNGVIVSNSVGMNALQLRRALEANAGR